MKSVKHLRELLGINLRDLAGLLGVSKTQLNYAENAIREFDRSTLLRLDIIQNCIQAKRKPAAKTKSCPSQMRNYCRKKELDYRLMLAVQQRKLDNMKTANEQVTCLMRVIDELEIAEFDLPGITYQK